MSKHLEWVPIQPELNEDNAFRTLSILENGKDCKPVPLENAPDVFAAYNEHKNLSKHFSSKLKIAALGGIENNFNSKTIIYDAVVYKEATITDTPIGGLIYGTRWGIGARFKMTISEISFGLNIGIGNVGASSELGMCNAEYEISGIGINDKELFAYLPDPGNITVKTMHNIFKSLDKILKFISKADKAKYALQPFMIQVAEGDEFNPLIPHQHMVFAYQAIKSRRKLIDAQRDARQKGLDTKLIRQIYEEEFQITNAGSKPSRSDRTDAEEWLNI